MGKKRETRKIFPKKTFEERRNKAIKRIASKARLEPSNFKLRVLNEYGKTEKVVGEGKKEIIDITKPVRTFIKPLELKVEHPIMLLDGETFEKQMPRMAGKTRALNARGYVSKNLDPHAIVKKWESHPLEEHILIGAHEAIHLEPSHRAAIQSIRLFGLAGLGIISHPLLPAALVAPVVPYAAIVGHLGEKRAHITGHLDGESNSRAIKKDERFEYSLLETPRKTLKVSKKPFNIKKQLKRIHKELLAESEKAKENLKKENMNYKKDIETIHKETPLEIPAFARKMEKIEKVLGKNAGTKVKKKLVEDYLEHDREKREEYSKFGTDTKEIFNRLCLKAIKRINASQFARANAIILASEHVLKKTPKENREEVIKKIKSISLKEKRPRKVYWEILKLQENMPRK